MARAPTRVTPRKQPRQERSRETVRAILEAAARVFAERGSEGATTDAIAARAGVSIGSLYQYFPSKQALLATLAACHRLETRAALEPVCELIARDAPVDAVAPALVRALVRLHAAHPRLDRLLHDDAPRDSDAVTALAALHGAFCDRLARWLASRPEARCADPALAACVGFDAVSSLAHGAALEAHAGATAEQREVELARLLRRYFTGAP
jgi:AcrR family transcriptional regulator